MAEIHYSTNWMGPISLDWYRERGLLEKKIFVVDEDSIFVKTNKYKVGDTVEYEEPIVEYSGGRIDVYGLDEKKYYGGMTEISLPVMHSEDWYMFSEWLDTIETDSVWTLAQLVAEYEKTNLKIRWADSLELTSE